MSSGRGLKQVDDFPGEFVVVDFAVTRENMVTEMIFLIRYNFVVSLYILTLVHNSLTLPRKQYKKN